MKKLFFLILFLILVFQENGYSSKFEGGDNITISDPVNDDIYLAAGTININATIYGDVIAAGGTINFNDSIMEDFTAAAGNFFISGYVGDDVRIAGGNITISGIVEGDMIIAGGKIIISKTAIVKGDLVITGGEVTIDGKIEGSLKLNGGKIVINGIISSGTEIRGGELTINGTIMGNSIFSSHEINLGDQAQIIGNIEYWTREGEIDFSSIQREGTALFNEDLKMEEASLGGIILFFILIILSAILLITVIVICSNKLFEGAGFIISDQTARSLGYGILYLIGLPLISLILMITVIGIPLALLSLNFYIISILLGHVFSSIVLANLFSRKYRKQWSKKRIIIVSSGIFILLKLIFLIPFIGFLGSILLFSLSFGAILLQIKERTNINLLNKGETRVN